MSGLTYDSDRLIAEWRQTYTNRGTIAWEMLEQAEMLVRDAVARELEQDRREQKRQREWDLERREREVEHAEGRHEREKDRLRRQLAEAKETIGRLSPRATLMREERETVDQGTVVRIKAPTVPSYGDKNSVRPWTLGEIEEVATRLRMASAGDDAEVRFQRDAIEVCVPFPEYALPAPTKPAEPIPAVSGSRLFWKPPVVVLAVVAATAFVLIALLGLLLVTA